MKSQKEENFIDISTYLKFPKEKYIDIESEESSYQSEKELQRIKNIILGNNNNDFVKIKSLLQMLSDRLKKVYSFKNYLSYQNIEIGPDYFYSLWKNSFNKEKYKTEKAYRYFAKNNFIMTLEEMGNTLKKLLSDIEYKLFDEDPGKFESRIKAIISQY
jgi:hypothetical protein